jgi:tetratricopeptide (TPR) repeat protein
MAVITLEDMYRWLNRFDKPEGYLSPSLRQLISQADAALSENKHSEAWLLIDRVLCICNSYAGHKERVEARVKCAKIVYQTGNLTAALKLLEEAKGRYVGDHHNRGVVLWMLGYIAWQIPARHDDAIGLWMKSIKAFESSSEKQASNRDAVIWYKERCDEMRLSLKEAIANDGV